MKTSKSLFESRAEVLEKMEEIVALAKTEERDLTEDETTNFDSLSEKADALEVEAKRSQKWEDMQKAKVKQAPAVSKTEKVSRNWSLFKAINEIL